MDNDTNSPTWRSDALERSGWITITPEELESPTTYGIVYWGMIAEYRGQSAISST